MIIVESIFSLKIWTFLCAKKPDIGTDGLFEGGLNSQRNRFMMKLQPKFPLFPNLMQGVFWESIRAKDTILFQL